MEMIKARSIDKLKALGIDVPNHLPAIESLDEVKPRSAQDIALRLSAMAYVIGLGFGANGKDLIQNLEKYGLMSHVSDYERKLLEQEAISEQDKINMSWLPECAQSLAWCIGLTELNHFQHCDDDLATKIPFKESPDQFVKSAKLRPITDIQQEADYLYRLHWYARNCRLTGESCKVSEGIVSERRKAIDWAYGVEEDWDEIPQDT